CVADWMRVPTAREVRPWVDAIAKLVGDRTAREEARRRALGAAAGLSHERILDELAARLHRLVAEPRAAARRAVGELCPHAGQLAPPVARGSPGCVTNRR